MGICRKRRQEESWLSVNWKKYSGSNTPGEVAWCYDRKSGYKTHTVGNKQRNELGRSAMRGNVWEWCQDWHGSYGNSPRTNPMGAVNRSNRVYRGDGWFCSAKFCPFSFRFNNCPAFRSCIQGLRLALSE